jgi:hypothetical protein
MWDKFRCAVFAVGAFTHAIEGMPELWRGEGDLRVTMLPDHWAARLHFGSVMGGEVATRGTRGTHGECAEANTDVGRR